MRLISAVLALLALAACDRSKRDEPAPQPAPAIEVREVAAADGYGAPGDVVNAVAFWSHPSVNFESLVIAATDGGIKAFSIETGELVDAGSSFKATGLSVVYDGEGAAAQGYIVAFVEGIAHAILEIDNTTRRTRGIAVSGETNADAVCVGRQSDGIAIFEVSSTGLSSRTLTPKASPIFGELKPIIEMSGLIACHVDDRSGDIITISSDGAIKRVDPATGESFGLAFIQGGAPDASTLFLMTTPEPENAPGGAVAVLDGESGVINLFDLVDGHALGAVRIKSTFDLDAVASAKTIAAGYGNYGGVYRDGALAVVTTGGGPPVRLAPWNGILDALKLTLGENVDPRAPQAATETERVIDIELEQP